MSDSRKDILERIQTALSSIPPEEQPEDVKIPRAYRKEGTHMGEPLIKLFIERTEEYKAKVRRVKEKKVKETGSVACSEENAKRMVIPPGFPKEWIPGTIDPVYDRMENPLSNQELDKSDGVITTCALAVAQTGTIILNAGEGQGRRALTLLPDYHLCIVRKDQIVELVPQAFDYFYQQIKEEGPPITFISGPSATSDIELSRVEGVHGPRRLQVFIIG